MSDTPRNPNEDPSASIGPTEGTQPRYPKRTATHATLKRKVTKGKVRKVPKGFARTVTESQKPIR